MQSVDFSRLIAFNSPRKPTGAFLEFAAEARMGVSEGIQKELWKMSTVEEIVKAVKNLPPQEQAEVKRRQIEIYISSMRREVPK